MLQSVGPFSVLGYGVAEMCRIGQPSNWIAEVLGEGNGVAELVRQGYIITEIMGEGDR